MIKSALQWLKEQTAPALVMSGDREFCTDRLHPLKESIPEPLVIHTLTGLVDYIKAHEKVLQDLEGEAFFQVISHKEVKLHSGLFGGFAQRKTFLAAALPETRGYPFGQFMDSESFIIALQSCFVQDDATKGLLALVSSIKEEAVKTSADDGVSQTVTARAGVALVSEVKVPNPVTLRPFRTFMEVEQPAISCVFRLQKGPALSLHEADGGLWRIQAIQSIKNYLVKEMTQINQNIPVIA